MGMKSFYPKENWVKRKSRIKESVESLIKWVFEKTVNKSWQNRWETNFPDNMNFKTLEKLRKWAFSRVFCSLGEIHKSDDKIPVFYHRIWDEKRL